MSRYIRRLGPKIWMGCGIILWLAAFASARATALPGHAAPQAVKESARAQNPPQAAPTPVAAPKNNGSDAAYVGDETCTTCHSPEKEALDHTPHGQKVDERTPAAKQGCETCHGPGSKHVEDPGNVKPPRTFKKDSSTDVNATCETCHNKGPHALWQGSTHEARGLACTTCHSVHSAKSETHQLKAKTEPELCVTCHRTEVAKLSRTEHMPVTEGKLTCTSCHDPHGSTNERLLRKGNTVSEACTSCHADKRGPFLWEHAPVSEGCVTCHDPHGSPNEFQLVAKLPMLCQRCHVSSRHPSTTYDAGSLFNPTTNSGSNRLFGSGCVNCHVNIHGSNHASGQFFLR